MPKIITWCLYIDKEHERSESTILRFPEYLCGLKMNIEAAALWFPGWELRLYVDEPSLQSEPSVWKLVRELTQAHVKVIPCRPGRHPMTERYRPFVEEPHGVCVVRDIDSILSATDAKLIKQWMENDYSDVLQYKEKEMWLSPMGGGIAVKLHRLASPRPDSFAAVPKALGRGFDEPALTSFLSQTVSPEKRTTVRTRMTDRGVYCIDNHHADQVPETFDTCTILWTVPFHENHNGFAAFRSVPFSDTVSQARDIKVTHAHLYCHLSHHREDILNSDTAWFR